MTAGVRRAAGVLHWAAGMVSTTPFQPESAGSPFRFDWAELAGALGDLGVLVPIAVALIVKNGLTPAAVLLPAGLLDWDAKSVPAANHSGNSTLGRTAALSVGLETGVRDAEGVQRPSALDLVAGGRDLGGHRGGTVVATPPDHSGLYYDCPGGHSVDVPRLGYLRPVVGALPAPEPGGCTPVVAGIAAFAHVDPAVRRLRFEGWAPSPPRKSTSNAWPPR